MWVLWSIGFDYVSITIIISFWYQIVIVMILYYAHSFQLFSVVNSCLSSHKLRHGSHFFLNKDKIVTTTIMIS